MSCFRKWKPLERVKWDLKKIVEKLTRANWVAGTFTVNFFLPKHITPKRDYVCGQKHSFFVFFYFLPNLKKHLTVLDLKKKIQSTFLNCIKFLGQCLLWPWICEKFCRVRMGMSEWRSERSYWIFFFPSNRPDMLYFVGIRKHLKKESLKGKWRSPRILICLLGTRFICPDCHSLPEIHARPCKVALELFSEQLIKTSLTSYTATDGDN